MANVTCEKCGREIYHLQKYWTCNQCGARLCHSCSGGGYKHVCPICHRGTEMEERTMRG